ncbi:MAG: extra-cytoplasmic solute receptor protein [Hyphomicrobiales bacterium]|nr:extra-cytoplasmic solute receptor protein [Hyphomicrobiales bacterium]
MDRRNILKSAFAALATWGCNRMAFAQAAYPNKPLRLIVPFAAGGVSDAIARPWAEKVKSTLGSVIIENRGGAGGAVGAAAVANAEPDGYTILYGSNGTHVVTPIASTHPTYDPVRSFEPITVISVGGVCVAVHPSHPAKTLQDFVDYARQNPGKISYATAGVGSAVHMAAELLQSLTSTKMVHVPYRGGGPALTDLVSGQIPVGFIAMSGQVLELEKAGKIRLLALTTESRSLVAPNLPTAEEAGVPGCVVLNFAALYAPARTPRSIVNKISTATREAMADPSFVKLLIDSGFEPYKDPSPEAAQKFLSDELARWRPVIESLGLKLG